MVSRLFQEYDNDGDGFLNHIEFSGMINDLIDLSEKHYEEICEKVKVSPHGFLPSLSPAFIVIPSGVAR